MAFHSKPACHLPLRGPALCRTARTSYRQHQLPDRAVDCNLRAPLIRWRSGPSNYPPTLTAPRPGNVEHQNIQKVSGWLQRRLASRKPHHSYIRLSSNQCYKWGLLAYSRQRKFNLSLRWKSPGHQPRHCRQGKPPIGISLGVP